MKVIFRTDASNEIGTGHVMRCLTLASALKKQSSKVSFICQDLPGNLCHFVEESGYTVNLIPPVDQELSDARLTRAVLAEEHGEVDWLVVDHYGLSVAWESQVKPLAKHLLVIDDLADREHVCDVLLDDNFVKNYEKRYAKLVPEQCTLLLGPKFSLIRSCFERNAKQVDESSHDVRSILITMGGSDSLNITSWLLRSILSCDLQKSLKITVVAGPSFVHLDETEMIAQLSRGHTINIQQNVADIAKIMRETDLAISAGGQTCYELILSGVPTLVLAANKSQHAIMQELHQIGAIDYLGLFRPDLDQAFVTSFTELMHDSARRERMILSGRNLIDIRGTERVSRQMYNRAGLQERSVDLES